MKILRKIILFITVILMTLTMLYNAHINTFASGNFNISNRAIANVAVLLYSFDDFFLSELKQRLEDIQKENTDKVRFTFYDGKNNTAIQNEKLDSILKSDVDLIIGFLTDANESNIENVVLSVKGKNVPLILTGISPQVVSKVSKYYDKVAFILSNSKQDGIYQGQLLVDLWNTNKNDLDKNSDNILQYVLLQGKSNNFAAINRTKYVISTLNDSGIKTEQLALINADWSKELAKISIKSLLLKYTGKIEAIIANNDVMALGAIEALQEYGYNTGDKSKNIVVVGIDGISEAKDLIDKGFMTGTIVHNPKILPKQLFTVGMNFLNNLDPIENTDYNIIDGEILIPYPYEYIKK